MTSYQHIRQDYGKHALNESAVPENPVMLFKNWFEKALNSAVLDANAMVLSTVKNQKPSSRIVLLKDIEDQKFVFFTNYNSRKGHELAENQNAAILFFWPELEQQIRIEGMIERVSEAYSDAYFLSRPRGSQAGAIASHQSEILSDKAKLIQDMELLMQTNESLQRPAHWGGYQLAANYFEFWQGGANRLHDRITYTKEAQSWKIERLYP